MESSEKCFLRVNRQRGPRPHLKFAAKLDNGKSLSCGTRLAHRRDHGEPGRPGTMWKYWSPWRQAREDIGEGTALVMVETQD